MTRSQVAIIFVLVGLAGPVVAADGQVVRVGSKAFTESVILGEMAVHLATDAGFQAEHVEGLGGTRLLWEAIVAGKIDVYPEYTGTLTEEIFAGEGLSGGDELRERLAGFGLKASPPLGFNNTYVLGMKEELAARRGIRLNCLICYDLERVLQAYEAIDAQVPIRDKRWVMIHVIEATPDQIARPAPAIR